MSGFGELGEEHKRAGCYDCEIVHLVCDVGVSVRSSVWVWVLCTTPMSLLSLGE